MDSQSVTTTRPVSRETRARRRQRAYPWVSAPSTTAAVLLLLLRAITFMGSKASVTLGTVYGLYESAPVPDPSLGTFTATCIASDPGNAGVPFIGGYFTFSDNSGTAYFKVYKRRQGGDEIWTRTIAAPGGSQNLVLSCAADSSGNLYIATASTALTFDGKTNPVSAGIYGIFLSKLAGTSGDTIWTRALDYTSDGAGDALSIVWNHQANEVVLFGQMHNARRASKIPCLLRFEAVCGTFLSGVTVGAAENTLASRLAIGASGHIFVAGRTSVAVNNKQITCVTTGCFSCFLSIYTMNIHQQTAITSGTNECYGLALSADHQVYVNKVAVYMDVGNSNAHRFVSLACLYYDSTMLATILEFNLGSISTSIGAVFLQNDKILVTGVTSEEVYANRPTEFPATFIAEFSGKALQGIQFYSSSSIPGGPVENRISEMVWSSSLFKVMALMGKSHNAATGVVYAPKWLAVGCKHPVGIYI